MLRQLCPPAKPLVFGIDETVERRWGRKIAAKGRYRDPVRSTDDRAVMTPGLQWVSLMLLIHIRWAGRYVAFFRPKPDRQSLSQPTPPPH